MSYQTAPPRGPNKNELYNIIYLMSNENKETNLLEGWIGKIGGMECWSNVGMDCEYLAVGRRLLALSLVIGVEHRRAVIQVRNSRSFRKYCYNKI